MSDGSAYGNKADSARVRVLRSKRGAIERRGYLQENLLRKMEKQQSGLLPDRMGYGRCRPMESHGETAPSQASRPTRKGREDFLETREA